MSGDKLPPSFNILKSSHTKSGGQLGTLAVTAGVMASSVLGTNLKSNSLEKKIKIHQFSEQLARRSPVAVSASTVSSLNNHPINILNTTHPQQPAQVNLPRERTTIIKSVAGGKFSLIIFNFLKVDSDI